MNDYLKRLKKEQKEVKNEMNKGYVLKSIRDESIPYAGFELTKDDNNKLYFEDTSNSLRIIGVDCSSEQGFEKLINAVVEIAKLFNKKCVFYAGPMDTATLIKYFLFGFDIKEVSDPYNKYLYFMVE